MAALKKGLVGKALDQEIRRLSACTATLTIEHELPPMPNNRLTLSAQKDWLGLNKPNIYYDVSDYVRRSATTYSVPILKRLMTELGVVKARSPRNSPIATILWGDASWGRTLRHPWWMPIAALMTMDNLFLPGGGAMTTGGSGNSTLTMVALAIKAGDAIVDQLKKAG